MPQSYVNLIYHIVFSTKDRNPIITEACESRLHEYIGGTIRGLGGIALAINGTEDHVHVLAKLRQDKAVSDVLRDLKANASGWMRTMSFLIRKSSRGRTATAHSPSAHRRWTR